MKFRTLCADEIECRVSAVKSSGISLLLYKNARADMNILDETVGAENWQRSHSRDNANCTVSIWDEQKNSGFPKKTQELRVMRMQTKEKHLIALKEPA